MPIHENFRKSTLEHRGTKEGALPALGNGPWLLKNLLHSWFLRGKTWQVGKFVFCLGEPSSPQPTPHGSLSLRCSSGFLLPLSQAPQAEELKKKPHSLTGVSHESGCFRFRSRGPAQHEVQGKTGTVVCLWNAKAPGSSPPRPRLSRYSLWEYP